MKLFRMTSPGRPNPRLCAVLADGAQIVLPDIFDINQSNLERGVLRILREWLSDPGKTVQAPLVPDDAHYLPPIADPSKIVCVGMNYAKHAAEQKMEPPKEPVLFMKATTALCGPFDDLVLPRGSVKSDWEVELAVIIGKRAKYIDKAQWREYVAGYAVHNDYSEREYQLERGGQWDKGKGCDTFAPLGPWLVTPDDVPDPNKLDLWLSVNGEEKQRGNTSDMIFDVPHLIWYVSQFMTLLPGDIISTGTPSGVGCFMKPPQYLRAGDVVELGIDGLGSSKQEVVEETLQPEEPEAGISLNA